MENQDPTQQPTRVNLSDDLVKEQKTQRKVNMAIGIIVAIIIIAGGAFAYWQYYQKQNSDTSTPTPSPTPPDNGSGTSTTTEPGLPTTTPPIVGFDPLQTQTCANRLTPVTSKSGMVEWVSPTNLDSLHIFEYDGSIDDNGYSLSLYTDISYLVGHVKSGKYQGGDVIVAVVQPEGPSAGDRYRIISKDGKYYYLGKYSDPLPDPQLKVKFATTLTVDKDFDLPDLDFPENLHLGSPKADFTYAPSIGFFKNGVDFFCADHLTKVFTDPVVGDVYTDALTAPINPGLPNSYYPRFGFYVKGGDASMRYYQLSVPITNPLNVPLVTWTDGKKNTDEYAYQAFTGCGVSNFRDVADVKLSDLAQIGTAFDGSLIYAYKDKNTKELKDIYDQSYFPEGTTKPTYDQFVAGRPIFFWQDPFGKLIRFKSKKYQPLAECGKPVIYLYPQQTQKISVKLNPVGGFSYTEPLYNNGWNVIADSQGNITNLADGKVYPYLFWEGRGGMYQTPARGFVVAQSDVHSLLVDKLGLLGLNEKESADFMEFWEPKMQAAPYYFVTFLGNRAMDEIAPLTVSPKPDTVIRILMDFTPLEQPMTVEGFNIRTPERKGFTVVEWGGVLR